MIVDVTDFRTLTSGSVRSGQLALQLLYQWGKDCIPVLKWQDRYIFPPVGVWGTLVVVGKREREYDLSLDMGDST